MLVIMLDIVQQKLFKNWAKLIIGTCGFTHPDLDNATCGQLVRERCNMFQGLYTKGKRYERGHSCCCRLFANTITLVFLAVALSVPVVQLVQLQLCELCLYLYCKLSSFCAEVSFTRGISPTPSLPGSCLHKFEVAWWFSRFAPGRTLMKLEDSETELCRVLACTHKLVEHQYFHLYTSSFFQ